MPEERRTESEAKFKAVTQAYEILRDEEKRQLYDQYGMAAFDPSRGGSGDAGVDLNDMLAQMFGMNVGSSVGKKRPRKGRNEEQQYKVTLEELYKGKTVKFAANKRITCTQCKGTGAKDKVKPQQCDRCKGAGVREAFRQVGPGLIQQEMLPCDHCQGSGMYYKERDRCKKCKGARTVEETKALEIYIPRGSVQGERIVLEGEADQFPDQVPGDIVFTLVEEPHEIFSRDRNDLLAELKVSLSEALTGFSRIVLRHLDGRGIYINHPQGKILRPTEVVKVAGEGMPMKRGDLKGDLYLTVKIAFPEDGWLNGDSEYETLQKLLPAPTPPISTSEVDEVDEVQYEANADIEQVCLFCALCAAMSFVLTFWKMGGQSSDPRFGGEWEDADDDEQGAPQCATQ